jgi:hypothetical protein
VGSLGGPSTTPTAPTTNASRTTTTGAHHHARTTHKATHSTRPPPPPKPATVTLKLVPTSSVYVCLENGAGRRLIPGVIYAPGQTIPTETARKLLLTLGNGGVQMQVDGKPMTLAPGSPIGYELTPGKTRLLASGQLPTCA